LIYKLRAKFGNYFIKRILSKSERNVHVVDLAKAKSVGILFKDADAALLTKIEKFGKEIASKFNIKEIHILAYTTKRAKEKPAYIKQSTATKFFSIKDTNFFLKPTTEVVKDFLEKPKDILIDFSKNKFEPLRFVTALSDAPFKVGRYAEQDEDFYDLMITLEDHKTDEEFFTQLMHYLNMINENNGKK